MGYPQTLSGAAFFYKCRKRLMASNRMVYAESINQRVILAYIYDVIIRVHYHN